jgi:hypothetical protein
MGRRLLLLIVLAAVTAACALDSRPTLHPTKMAELWEPPTDLERRDLLYGPGGSQRAPDPNGRFDFLRVKGGTQPGYDVKDVRGQEWSVKQGVEGRTEVVVSRLLWALGYHQPYIYYVPEWTLTRDGEDTVQPAGRFRLEPLTQTKIGEWSWRNNPFHGTRPMAGLFVLMVMINNWDLKTAQNAIYEVSDADQYRYAYMVRDLGASFGRTSWFSLGTKDDLSGFEREPFIKAIEGNRVYFHFQGAWREPQLHSSVTPDDRTARSSDFETAPLREICAALIPRFASRGWLAVLVRSIAMRRATVLIWTR